MSTIVRRVHSALRRFNPNQKYFHGARLFANESGGATIETYWRNPELAGVWVFCYVVTPRCFRELVMKGYIEHDGSDDPGAFVLSEEGKERLGKD